jgi:hypothetical protein
MRRIVAPVAMIAIGMLLAASAAACGDDGEDSGGDASAGSTVSVTLKEFEIVPDKDSVPAGSVTFRAKNIGPEDLHELVVVKTDLASNKLPTAEDGAADEKGAGVELIGEIEEFAVDGEEEITFDLKPGKYVLLCNIVLRRGRRIHGEPLQGRDVHGLHGRIDSDGMTRAQGAADSGPFCFARASLIIAAA